MILDLFIEDIQFYIFQDIFLPGFIIRKKDGRWEARYRKGKGPDGKIRYGYCYGRSYREVKEKREKAMLEHMIMPNKNTKEIMPKFGDFADAWLKRKRHQLKDPTIQKYNGMLENHIKPFLGNYRLNEMDTSLLAKFTTELVDRKELSPKTVRCIHTLFSSIWKSAKAETIIPLRDIILVAPREDRKEMRILSDTETRALKKYLLEHLDPCSLGILLTMESGLRIGEICALRWDHIDLEEEWIYVDRTMYRIQCTDRKAKTEIRIDTPKTAASRRQIPISPEMKRLLRENKPDSDTYFLVSGSEEKREPRQMQRRLKNILEELNIEGVHFHTLRHTFATRCIGCGFDMKTLSEILGHSSIQVTMNRYVHPDMNMKRKSMKKFWKS